MEAVQEKLEAEMKTTKMPKTVTDELVTVLGYETQGLEQEKKYRQSLGRLHSYTRKFSRSRGWTWFCHHGWSFSLLHRFYHKADDSSQRRARTNAADPHHDRGLTRQSEESI